MSHLLFQVSCSNKFVTPSQRKEEKFVDSIVQKNLGELAQKIGFSSNVFMVLGLPTRKLKGNPRDWEKKNPFIDLILTRHPRFEIPYGCYARMNQIYIDTEVKTKCTNIIDVGKSFREYTSKLGYKDGKANKALIRQLVNYCTSGIHITPKNAFGTEMKGLQTLIAKEWDISFDVSSPDQLILGKGQIRLDADYADYIYKHSAPLDMAIINLFKRNPLGLDLYRYLAYRNNSLTKEISFPDKYLFEQFGTEDLQIKKVRHRIKSILKMIQVYWPIKAKFEDEYFWMAPSDPIVKKLKRADNPLKLIHKL